MILLFTILLTSSWANPVQDRLKKGSKAYQTCANLAEDSLMSLHKAMILKQHSDELMDKAQKLKEQNNLSGFRKAHFNSVNTFLSYSQKQKEASELNTRYENCFAKLEQSDYPILK